MFSGIVEARSRLLEFTPADLKNQQATQIKVEKPKEFDDIKPGDSVAVNGVCLTVEVVTDEYLQFSLGTETLRVTQWSEASLRTHPVNLERSLKWSDRIHGHLVSGHIDSMGQVTFIQEQAGCRDLKVAVDRSLLPYFWQKGSITLNGVSLTVNEVTDGEIRVTLIPETLQRTNLAEVKIGDQLTIEIDQVARGLMNLLKNQPSARVILAGSSVVASSQDQTSYLASTRSSSNEGSLA